jgi:hypothetical protein
MKDYKLKLRILRVSHTVIEQERIFFSLEYRGTHLEFENCLQKPSQIECNQSEREFKANEHVSTSVRWSTRPADF